MARWLALLGVIVSLALGRACAARGGGSSSKLKLQDFQGKNVIVLIIDQMRLVSICVELWV